MILISLLMILLAGLALLYVCIKYRSNSVVREKRTLENQFAQETAQLRQTETRLAQVTQQKDRIDKDEERSVAERKKVYQDQIARLDQQHQASEQSEKDEIDRTLHQLQSNYYAKGLQSEDIESATILGIGPKMKEKLIISGVRCAGDISAQHILTIPGFGEAKVQVLVAWRRLVELRLDISKPKHLPDPLEKKIKETWHTVREQIGVEKTAQEKRLAIDLAAIKKQALEARAANAKAIEDTSLESGKWKGRVITTQSSLEEYEGVTFWNYFSHAVLPGRAITRSARLVGMGAFVAFLGLGPVAQGFFAIGSSSIILVSIPTVINTSTASTTPTSTFIPTNSNTPTFTATSTDTLTPTLTYTLTETLTPSVTPTCTRTPTKTKLPTATRRPTATIDPFAPPPAIVLPAVPTMYPTLAPVSPCCKVCTTGKACGNTCINKNYTCHKPPGCACNG
ncbi:MAG: hypothetical protein PHQ40_15270 [Anaerolineaceae bacterium]|nr:hypothetical protein [Anaerolineaceae bacterium]